MKNSPLSFCLTLTLVVHYSCKKSNSGSTAPQSNYYLSTAVASTPLERIVDSFYYDTLHRLDTFTQYIYYTLNGAPVLNTWTIQFIYQDTNSWPSWYNFYDRPLGGLWRLPPAFL